MDPVTLSMAKADARRQYSRRGDQVGVTSPEMFYAPSRIGASNYSFVCLGVSPTTPGRMYFYRATSPGSIVQSDDYGATFSSSAATVTGKTLPSGVSAGNIASVVEFGGYVYIYGTDGTSFGAWRTPVVAQGSDFGAWSGKLFTMPSGTAALSHISFFASNWGSGDALYACAYGDPTPTGRPVIKKSTDGTTWTTIWTGSSVRHVHHMNWDPYRPGHLWLTVGDGIANCVLRSTDYGATFTAVLAPAGWQAVQISFDANYVWFARDSLRASVFLVDRDTLTARAGSTNYHHYIAPPTSAGVGYRAFTDLVATAGSATVTSDTAAFAAPDKGRYLSIEGILPPLTYILTVNSATSVTVNKTALSNKSAGFANTAYLSGNMFLANAFFGVVDPDTGIWYQAAVDTSGAGQIFGLFYMREAGGQLAVLDPGSPSYGIGRAPILYGNYLWIGNYRYPRLSRLS